MVDKRDPIKLYERIQKIRKSNPNMSIIKAADIADEEHKQYIATVNGNGKVQ